MHQCHGGTVLVTQDNIEEHHKKCPLCNAEGETKPHACDKGKADCCKDIKLDLKKSKDDAENTHASLAFFKSFTCHNNFTLDTIRAIQRGPGNCTQTSRHHQTAGLVLPYLSQTL